MASITFDAPTLRELESKIRAFLGDPPAVAVAAAAVIAANPGRKLPSWAPEGSRWMELPGAPALIGPDGAMIPLDWSGVAPGGEPKRGVFVRYHDPAAEAAGAALLASQRGDQ